MSAPDHIAAMLARATAGIRLLERDEYDALCQAEAREAIARKARAFRLHLEPKLSPETYARLAHARLRPVVDRWEPSRGSLRILGPAGCGKTITAKRLGRRQLRDAWQAGDAQHPIVGARWVTATEVATSLREQKLGSPCNVMREAQTASILFLDELGQELSDPRWLLELLDARISPRILPTVTTSGLTNDELVKRYGTGAVRRLVEPFGTTLDLWEGSGA